MNKYKRQSENKSFNEMLDTILEGLLERKLSMSDVPDVKAKECSDEDMIEEIVAQCKMKDVAAAVITMNFQELIDVVCSNIDKLRKSDGGYIIRPEFSEGMALELRGNADVRPGDVLIGIVERTGENEEYNLVDYMCDDDEGYLAVKMSLQTLDMVVQILKDRGQEPLMLDGRVLIPCSGYKLVKIDNDITFGKIAYTNEV